MCSVGPNKSERFIQGVVWTQEIPRTYEVNRSDGGESWKCPCKMKDQTKPLARQSTPLPPVHAKSLWQSRHEAILAFKKKYRVTRSAEPPATWLRIRLSACVYPCALGSTSCMLKTHWNSTLEGFSKLITTHFQLLLSHLHCLGHGSQACMPMAMPKN